MIEKSDLEKLQEWNQDYLSRQQSLGSEFEKVLCENYQDLYDEC